MPVAISWQCTRTTRSPNNRFTVLRALVNITVALGMDTGTVFATVESTNDYYPFGLAMAGRTWKDPASNYRFGFNGKEKDSNFNATVYDYGFRIYNPEIARFLSVDPLTRSYPELTPYQFASNTPIQAIDIDGREAGFVQGGVRVSVPLVPSMTGITLSVNAGVAFDLGGNIAIYSTPSFGAQNGIGFATGLSGGINFGADNINDISGWGLNAGGFLGGLPGVPAEVSLELNWALEGNSNNLIELLLDPNTKYNFGFNGGFPIPNTGYTVGASVYGEVGYTTFHSQFNIVEELQKSGVEGAVTRIISEFNKSLGSMQKESILFKNDDFQKSISNIVNVIKQIQDKNNEKLKTQAEESIDTEKEEIDKKN
jgi:RHS repeat-associated protein